VATNKVQLWKVSHEFSTLHVEAKTYGAACRIAFREWIRNGKLKRQPDSTDEGGFEGVSVRLAITEVAEV